MDGREVLLWELKRLLELKEEMVLKVVQGANPVDVGELKGIMRVIDMVNELLNSQEVG